MSDFIVIQSSETATSVQVVERTNTVINTFPGGPVIVSGDNTTSQAIGETIVAGANLSGHRAIALVGGLAVYADCTIVDHAYLTRGVSQSAVVSGANLLVFNRESIEESTWSWSPGQPVFLGQGGVLSQLTPVSPALFVLQVGTAITPTRLEVNIQQPIFI